MASAKEWEDQLWKCYCLRQGPCWNGMTRAQRNRLRKAETVIRAYLQKAREREAA